MSSKRRIVVLSKRTSYQKLVEHDHDARVEALLEKDDVTVRNMKGSHEAHEATMSEVRTAVRELGIDASFLEGPRTPIEGSFDLVVTVGGDGTLLATSHQVGPNVPLLGINSAPEHSVGFFCGGQLGNVQSTLSAALEHKLHATELTRMRVDLNGKCLHARVLNEVLFCHPSPAATSKYVLRVLDDAGRMEEEVQRSSGVWIGPAAGSTAAQRSAGGRVLPLASTRIQWVVREPYTPIGVPLRLPLGLVPEDGQLELRNKMREAKLFVDGEAIVFDATIGDVIVMRRSEEPVTVLGLTRNGDPKPASVRPPRRRR